MAAPKLNKPEGLAALIGAAMYAAQHPETMNSDGSVFDWQEILREFQEYNCVKFAAFFSGQEEAIVKASFDQWKNMESDEPKRVRSYSNRVEFKGPTDEPEPTI